jgi:hypothetical protein
MRFDLIYNINITFNKVLNDEKITRRSELMIIKTDYNSLIPKILTFHMEGLVYCYCIYHLVC